MNVTVEVESMAKFREKACLKEVFAVESMDYFGTN